MCGWCRFRVDGYLRNAEAIAQVDKNKSAMIPTAVYPSGQSRGFFD